MLFRNHKGEETHAGRKGQLAFHSRSGIVLACTALAAACTDKAADDITVAKVATPDLSTCIVKTMELDEGRWDYVGTIARLDGGVRTYETTSIHSANDDGSWTNKSFGGDVGGTEETAESEVLTLIGNSIAPIVGGEPNLDAAIETTACKGPDPQGRYEVKKTYRIPAAGGGFNYAENVSWYGENGSYFAENIRNEDGRIVARRSGVNMPADE